MQEPRLRFKEFNDEWKNEHISKLCNIVMGQSPSSKNYTNNDSDEILVQGNADLKSGYVVPRIYTKQITKQINKNSIILTVRAPVGEVAINQFKNVVIGRGVAGISGNSFVYNYFKYLPLISYWKKLESGSTFNSINSNDIKNIEISYPSITEQSQIGNLFIKLDKLIELQTSKLDHLKRLKKGYLQKMFPSGGDDVPGLRFKRFNNKWTNDKIGNLLDYEQPTKYLVNNNHYKTKGIPVLTANKSFLLGYTNENDVYNKGKCIIFDDFTENFKFVNFNFKVKSSAIKILTSKNNNICFIYSLFQSINFLNEGHKRHYISVVQNTTVKIPSLEEQNKIGNFFDHFDQLIKLQTSKLEHLKQIKKAYLQKMFI